MKKLLLITPLLFVLTSSSFAQPQKGSWLVGASIANGGAAVQPNINSVFNFNISPKAGYFLSNRLALGTGINFGIGGSATTKQFAFNYGASPFLRYYFAKKEGMQVNKAYLFTEVSAGYNGTNYREGIAGGRYTSNMLQAGAGLGLAYFIAPNVSIEGLFKMNYATGVNRINTNVGQFRPSIGFGFQIYLRSKKEKATIAE